MIYKSHPWQPWSVRQIVPMVINDQLIKMLHFSKEIKNMLNAETNYISEWFIKTRGSDEPVSLTWHK